MRAIPTIGLRWLFGPGAAGRISITSSPTTPRPHGGLLQRCSLLCTKKKARGFRLRAFCSAALRLYVPSRACVKIFSPTPEESGEKLVVERNAKPAPSLMMCTLSPEKLSMVSGMRPSFRI